MTDNNTPIDEVDRKIIEATQEGLPLTPQPYHDIAKELGLEAADVIHRFKRMLSDGIIRRIAVVPNHYALGFKANGMSVWNVPDEHVSEMGKKIGALDFVSHCYHRPRHLPDWPFNFFAMVHGRDRDEVEAKAEQIAELLAENDLEHRILYSTRILKKTGFRLQKSPRSS